MQPNIYEFSTVAGDYMVLTPEQAEEHDVPIEEATVFPLYTTPQEGTDRELLVVKVDDYYLLIKNQAESASKLHAAACSMDIDAEDFTFTTMYTSWTGKVV